MISITTLIIAPLTLIFLILAFYALTTATSFFNRVIITTALVLGLGISFMSFNQLLSLPKSIEMEWILKNIKVVEVIDVVMHRGEAIYLWLGIPGIKEPRYYVLKWDDGMARQFKKALDERNQNKMQGRIIMNNPFSRNEDNSLENRKSEDGIKFVPIQKQLPEKSYEKN